MWELSWKTLFIFFLIRIWFQEGVRFVTQKWGEGGLNLFATRLFFFSQLIEKKELPLHCNLDVNQ